MKQVYRYNHNYEGWIHKPDPVMEFARTVEPTTNDYINSLCRMSQMHGDAATRNIELLEKAKAIQDDIRLRVN